jgi:hypothetical protein
MNEDMSFERELPPILLSLIINPSFQVHYNIAFPVVSKVKRVALAILQRISLGEA